MAIYVTSDLHGMPLSKLRQLLKKVHFCGGDWLYILGDVIDRENDGGVEILQWLLVQPNVQLLLGNHEAMLLSCDFLFETVTEESIARLSSEQMDLLMTYTQNGGDVTLTALRELAKESPETVEDILDYLRDAPLYDIVEAAAESSCWCTRDLRILRPTESFQAMSRMNCCGRARHSIHSILKTQSPCSGTPLPPITAVHTREKFCAPNPG